MGLLVLHRRGRQPGHSDRVDGRGSNEDGRRVAIMSRAEAEERCDGKRSEGYWEKSSSCGTERVDYGGGLFRDVRPSEYHLSPSCSPRPGLLTGANKQLLPCDKDAGKRVV
jgi:hypothetical protein